MESVTQNLCNFLCNCDFLILWYFITKEYTICFALSRYEVKSVWSSIESFNDLYKQTQALLLSPVFFVSGLQWGAQCLCLHYNAFSGRFHYVHVCIFDFAANFH